MLCVVAYKNIYASGNMPSYRAECRFAPGELQSVQGNANDIYSAAGNYLHHLAEFIEKGGKLHDVYEAHMRRARIRGVSRIRDQPFLTAQFRYPKETLEREELVHFYEGFEW